MKKNIFPVLVCFFTMLSVLSGCSKRDNDPPSNEPSFSYLINAEEIAKVPAAEIKQRYPLASSLVASDVTAYKITYKTKFLDGSDIEASGLILIPNNKTANLTLLGFQHGTITSQEEAPSAYKPEGNMEAYVAGTVGASLAKGYMVVMPDYIGFGASKQLQHPYQEKTSLASACLDMYRAAREFAGSKDISLRKEIRLLGYSEGGYATMAVHQAIEREANDVFTVESSFPGAGAYDIAGTAKWVVGQDRDLAAGATALYVWTMLTYNEIYGVDMQLTDMLQPAAAQAVLAALSNGNLMEATLSDNPSEVFSASFVAGLQNGTNTAFLAALQKNDVYEWKPNAPVVLFHAVQDDIVPVLNTENAATAMTALGAEVQFVSLGDVGHREGSAKYMQAVIPLLVR